MENSDAVVIGAGPAGLAAAACLIQRGLRPMVLERALATWVRHGARTTSDSICTP